MNTDTEIAIEHACECIGEELEHIENRIRNKFHTTRETTFKPPSLIYKRKHAIKLLRLDWIKRLYWIYLLEKQIGVEFSDDWWEEQFMMKGELWHRRKEVLKYIKDKDREPINLEVPNEPTGLFTEKLYSFSNLKKKD